MSGSSPSARGSCQVGAPPCARVADRARAPSKTGFCQSPPTIACTSGGSPSELPRLYRDTHSTPAEMNTSPSPARIACIAIRVVCRDDEQYRVSVAPGRKSYPRSTATTRAMLKPCSPPGRPQPRYRSSISCGSSWGTFASAARMIVAARSSGRRAAREPLTARPIGERAVATMTASGMGSGYRAVSMRVPRQLVRHHTGRFGDGGVQGVGPDAVAVGGGMETVVTEGTGVGAEHRPGPFGEVDRYPTGLADRVGLGTGDPAPEHPGELAQRRCEGANRAEVRTGTHDHRDPRVAQSSDRTAQGGGRRGRAAQPGRVVRTDQDHGHLGPVPEQRPGDLGAE